MFCICSLYTLIDIPKFSFSYFFQIWIFLF
nr:MAG TPA: hypothetical protein [Caudoviricetes sp.]DAW30933.1 MAG TPA: hypothetical protein [Caudoviricetes sp.]DAW46255.1 MAG TPA: hypothetical protein [Bacteriophage sp.]